MFKIQDKLLSEYHTYLSEEDKTGFAGHFFTIIIDKHLNRSLGKLLITASNNCTCFRKGNMKLCLEEPIVLLQFEVMQCYVIH